MSNAVGCSAYTPTKWERLEYLVRAHVGIVKQIRCTDTRHLVEYADEIVIAGGEGAVVRNPRARYIAGRTDDVLRWVPQCPRMNRRKAA